MTESGIASQVVRAVVTMANPAQPAVLNLSLPAANTEYTQALPAATLRFSVQNRGAGRLKVAYTEGESASNYWTVWPGCTFEEKQIQGPLTLYIQSPKPLQTIEVTYWTA